MGRLAQQYLDNQRQSSSPSRSTVKTSADLAAEEQAEAKRYNVGAAGGALLAAKQSDVVANGERMLETLKLAGTTAGSDWDRAATMAAHGYDPKITEEPLLQKITGGLSWLDKLGATVRFGIGDILGLDQKYETEFGVEDFKDIWKGEWASIRERHGDVVGEEGRFGGSDMLTAATGWLPAEEWADYGWVNKIARFIPAAGIELLTDPLTFMSGGLGVASKKGAITAAQTALRGASQDVLPFVTAAVRQGSRRVGDDVAGGFLRRHADDVLAKIPEFGDDVTDEIIETAIEGARKAAFEKEMMDIGEAIATRDFNLLKPDWVQFTKGIKGLRNTTGGLRITANPIGNQGFQLPFTRGLGRTITRTVFGTAQDSNAIRGALGRRVKDSTRGTGIRGLIDRKTPMTEWTHAFLDSWGTENHILRAYANRTPGAVEMSMLAGKVKEKSAALGVNKIANDLGFGVTEMRTILKRAGIREGSEEMTEVWRALLDHTQGGRLMTDGFRHEIPEVEAAVRRFADIFRSSMDRMHGAAKAAGIELGHLENYVPAVRSSQLEDFFSRLRAKGIAIPAKAPAGIDQRAYDLASELFAASNRRGVGDGRAIVGATAFANERKLGQTIKTKVTDIDQVTIFDLMDNTAVDFLDHTTMNDLLTTAFTRIAEDNNIALPKAFAALELDPIQIAAKYMTSMISAVEEAVIVKTARSVGLIKAGTWQIDSGRMAAQLQRNWNDLGQDRLTRMKTHMTEAIKKRDDMVTNMQTGNYKSVWEGEKVVKEKIGGTWIPVYEAVANNRTVRHTIEQAQRHFAQDGFKHGKLLEDIEVAKKALIRQGLTPENAQLAAEQQAMEPIFAIARAQQAALMDDAAEKAAGVGEMAARYVLEGERGREVAVALLRDQRIYDAQRLREVSKVAKDAVDRVAAHYKLGGAASVARFDSPESLAGLASQLKPSMMNRLELMADSVEAIKGGGPVAEEIRKVLDLMLDMGPMSPDDFAKVSAQIVKTREMFELMQGGGPTLRSFDEWVADIPLRQRKIGTTEAEGVIKEWKESGVRVPDLPPPLTADDMAIKTRNNEWFDAFEEMYGVDLRVTPKRYRNQLKQLLQPVPDTVDGTDAFETVRRQILSTNGGRAMPKAAQESFQDILIDIWSTTKAPKRGARRPPWGRLSEEELEAASLMDSDTFFDMYGKRIAEWVAEAGPDTPMWRASEAYNHLYRGSQVGKHIDSYLAQEITQDLTLLDALANGRNVWRDASQKATLERLFNESGMAAEWRLVGAPGGKFQIQSLHEVTTLTQSQLKRELKLAGYNGSVTQAAEDIANGTLQSSVLSREALNTIGLLPTAERAALDALHEAQDRSLQALLVRNVGEAESVVQQAVDAQKLLNRLSKSLLKRGADGNITAGALRDAQAILYSSESMRLLRSSLPVEQHAVLDGLRQVMETQELYRGMNPYIRQIVDANNALRNDMMFDPQKVRETMAATEEMIAKARQVEELAEAQDMVDTWEMTHRVLADLLGMAPSADPRIISRGLLLGDDGAEQAEKLLTLGSRAAEKLDWEIDPFKGVRSGAITPTAATPGYTPAEHFGLGGLLVEGRQVEDHLGKFLEHTISTMIKSSTPAGLRAFTQGARQTLTWWKGMATVARASFHVRNHLSAHWNNLMADVRPGDYAYVTHYYGQLMSNFKKTQDWAEAARMLPDPKAAKIFENAATAGLFRATYAESEALTLAAGRGSATTLQKVNPLGKHGPLLYAGGRAMQGIEGYHRLAAFVRHFDYEKVVKYGDAEYERLMREAANEWVNTVHFDYNSLTSMENTVRKIAPFFVWTRRNLPLQMRALVEQPRMIAAYQHLMGRGNNDGSPRRFEGQVYADTGLTFNEDTDFWAKLIMDVDLPVKDLFQITGKETDSALGVALNPMTYVNLAANLLGPHIAEPLAALQDDNYQVSAPVGFQSILGWLHTDDQQMGQVPRIDNWQASMLRTLFPPLGEYAAGFTQDPRGMQRLGLLEGEDDLSDRLMASLFKVGTGGFGLGTKAVADDEALASQAAGFEYGKWVSELMKGGYITQEVFDAAEAARKRNR